MARCEKKKEDACSIIQEASTVDIRQLALENPMVPAQSLLIKSRALGIWFMVNFGMFPKPFRLKRRTKGNRLPIKKKQRAQGTPHGF